MPRRLILSFALPLLLVGASTAAAQGRRGNGADRGLVEVAPVGVRSGFFLTAGIGAGGEQYRFDGDPFTSQLTKPTVTLRLGGAPNQNVRVGGELFGWWNPVNDGVTSTESFGMLLLAAQYYPSTAGLYLKGGAGLARSGVSYYNGASTNERGSASTWARDGTFRCHAASASGRRSTSTRGPSRSATRPPSPSGCSISGSR